MRDGLDVSPPYLSIILMLAPPGLLQMRDGLDVSLHGEYAYDDDAVKNAKKALLGQLQKCVSCAAPAAAFCLLLLSVFCWGCSVWGLARFLWRAGGSDRPGRLGRFGRETKCAGEAGGGGASDR